MRASGLLTFKCFGSNSSIFSNSKIQKSSLIPYTHSPMPEIV